MFDQYSIHYTLDVYHYRNKQVHKNHIDLYKTDLLILATANLVRIHNQIITFLSSTHNEFPDNRICIVFHRKNESNN